MPSSPRYEQAGRSLSFHSPLGADALLVEKFEAEEGLSQLFRIRLELLAPRGGTAASVAVPFEQLVGQPAGVRLSGAGTVRHFHGIVRQMARVENNRDREFRHFEAELVPALWLWTQRLRSRVFQRQSVPDILRQVLEELRPDVEVTLQGRYPVRDYCVQYRENDFHFASRLMEDEGISYFFRHEAERHVLVVTDHPSLYRDLPAVAELRYNDAASITAGMERITAWRTTRQVRPQVFSQRDQHFGLPGNQAGRPLQVLQAQSRVAGAVAVGTLQVPLTIPPSRPDAEPLEIYEHNSGLAHRFEGPGGANNLGDIFDEQRRVVALRQEAETAGAVAADGAGSYAHLAPGFKFQLRGLEELDGTYLLTRVVHTASQGSFRSGQENAFTYENHFACVPEGLPVRPERTTPKPRIESVQTAVVTGDREIDVDEYGRVRVQFYWDRADHYDANSSCRVRVAQAWAGNRYGAFFWPRPGHEVVVSFEDGDPDRPLITGSVYNAANMPPATLPQEAILSGFKTCSVGGDPAQHFNCVVFCDWPGDEHVLLHSEQQTYIRSEAMTHAQNPGPKLDFAGCMPPPQGSGSGGGIMQDFTAGMYLAAGIQGQTSTSWESKYVKKVKEYCPGRHLLTMGGTSDISFGHVNHSIYGGHNTSRVNLRELLVDRLPGGVLSSSWGSRLGILFNILFYSGHTINQDIGGRNDFTYIGPRLDVCRGPKYVVERQSIFADKSTRVMDILLTVSTLLDLAFNIYKAVYFEMNRKREWDTYWSTTTTQDGQTIPKPITISHGAVWQYRTSDQSDVPGTAGTAKPVQGEKPEPTTALELTMDGLMVAAAIMQGILHAMEMMEARIGAARAKVQAAKAAAEQAEKATAETTRLVAIAPFVPVAEVMTSQTRVFTAFGDIVRTNLHGLAADMEQLTEKLEGKGGLKTLGRTMKKDSFIANRVLEAGFSLSAPTIQLNAHPRDGQETAGVHSTAVNIVAGKEEAGSERAGLNLTHEPDRSSACCFCDKTSLTMSTQAADLTAPRSVSVNAQDEESTVTLFAGSAELGGPRITLNGVDKELVLAVGEPATGPRIRLAPGLIELRVGATMLTLTDLGINLMASPTSWFKLGADGSWNGFCLSFDVLATSDLVLQSFDMQLQGVCLGIKGAIIQTE